MGIWWLSCERYALSYLSHQILKKGINCLLVLLNCVTLVRPCCLCIDKEKLMKERVYKPFDVQNVSTSAKAD